MAAVESFDGIDMLHGNDLTSEELERFLTHVLGKNAGVSQAITNPIFGTASNTLPIPEQLLQEVSRDHSGIWKLADAMRESRIKSGDKWASHTFVPSSCWADALMTLHPLAVASFDDWSGNMIKETAILDFVGAWRLTKKVYRFEPNLLQALMATTLSGDIPCETLKRLPEWAVYVETPDLVDEHGRSWDGFGACIAGGDDDRYWLQLEWMRREPNHTLSFQAETIPLKAGMNLESAIRETHVKSVAASGRHNWTAPALDEKGLEVHVRFVSASISMLLWLSSEEPDVAVGWNPSKPIGKRVKHGTRHFPAESVTTWDVGVRVGAALDMAAEKTRQEDREWKGGTHARPRGHIRRAHWHTYRTGPKGGVPVVKWISPILVNLGKHQSFPVAVCPVV